jgi:hypothetical protein
LKYIAKVKENGVVLCHSNQFEEPDDVQAGVHSICSVLIELGKQEPMLVAHMLVKVMDKRIKIEVERVEDVELSVLE